MDNFLRAAGAFQYILENFTNAPSMDLSPDTLEMLVHLMCAQARECLFEKAELALFEEEEGEAEAEEAKEDGDSSPESNRRKKRSKERRVREGAVEECLVLGQEAAHVSNITCFPSKRA